MPAVKSPVAQEGRAGRPAHRQVGRQRVPREPRIHALRLGQQRRRLVAVDAQRGRPVQRGRRVALQVLPPARVGLRRARRGASPDTAREVISGITPKSACCAPSHQQRMHQARPLLGTVTAAGRSPCHAARQAKMYGLRMRAQSVLRQAQTLRAGRAHRSDAAALASQPTQC